MTLAEQMAARVYCSLRNDGYESGLRLSPAQLWFECRQPSPASKQAFYRRWQQVNQQAFDVAPAITRADIATELRHCFVTMGRRCRVQPLRWHIYGVFTFGEQDAQIYDIHYEEQTNGKR